MPCAGKVVKLDPPLLVLERDGDASLGAPDDPEASFGVAGIAHSKLLFKDRPKLGLKR